MVERDGLSCRALFPCSFALLCVVPSLWTDSVRRHADSSLSDRFGYCINRPYRKVGFVKVKADCRLIDGRNHHEHRLPGICFLRGAAVAILIGLYCDDGKTYSLLVEQPRYVPSLHLPKENFRCSMQQDMIVSRIYRACSYSVYSFRGLCRVGETGFQCPS